MLNVEPEALLEVLGEAETRAKKLAESDEYGFIAAADANAENVVHSHNPVMIEKFIHEKNPFIL